MASALKRRGYSPGGCARQVVVADFDAFDLVLAMDEDNLSHLRDLANTAAQREKIRRFTGFCHHHKEREIPDPYYGGDEGFEDVADLIEDGTRGLLAWISQQLSA
jgi:protein-tyrosine phosphatase